MHHTSRVDVPWKGVFFHCFSTVFDWCSMFFYSAPRANEPMSTNLSTNGAPMSTNSVMEQEMANRRVQPHKR